MFVTHSIHAYLLSKRQPYVSIKNTVENSLYHDLGFLRVRSSLSFSETKEKPYTNLSGDDIFTSRKKKQITHFLRSPHQR